MSLLQKLYHCSKSEMQEKYEDYITEAYAYILATAKEICPDVFVEYLKGAYSIDKKLRYIDSIEIETQRLGICHEFEKRDKPDMVIMSTELCIICEHKVNSPETNEQIKRYKECADIIWKKDACAEVKVVFTGKFKNQKLPSAEPNVRLSWANICDRLEDYFKSVDKMNVIIRDFTEFIKEIGMRYEKVSKDAAHGTENFFKLLYFIYATAKELSDNGNCAQSNPTENDTYYFSGYKFGINKRKYFIGIVDNDAGRGSITLNEVPCSDMRVKYFNMNDVFLSSEADSQMLELKSWAIATIQHWNDMRNT